MRVNRKSEPRRAVSARWAGQRAEINALLPAAKAGDAAAREKVFVMILPVLKAVIARLGFDPDEYLFLAWEKFLLALPKFDPKFGRPFSAYVGQAIEMNIRREATAHGPIVRAPVWFSNTGNRELIQRLRRRAVSLQKPVGREKDDRLSDLLRDRREKPREDDPRAEVVREAMDRLNEREAMVLRLRLQGRTLGQIGKSLGCCKERVRQIEEAALETVRAEVAA